MSHDVVLALTGILVLGIAAQWVAWRLRIPSILLLLAAGIIAGPVTGFLRPEKLLGDLLLPIVSLSVAVILYEGGLNLRYRELREIKGVLLSLITIGVLVSWGVTTLAARYLLRFDWPVATLLGAVLVVTGPTVIGPLLRHLRLRGRVGALLKWEGIVIDPIGAILAVLVFTVSRAAEFREGLAHAGLDLIVTLIGGIVLGTLAAGIMVLALRRFWIPDALHNAVSLMVVLATFVAANALRGESGLVAVTVMGIVLANQPWVSVRHLIEFKENLTTLIIAALFVVLSARLEYRDLVRLGMPHVLFLAVIVLAARPLSVFCATLRSRLNWRERLFLACMAPRGIVAASISSVFALEIAAQGYQRAEDMVPATFVVVFGTVLLYGLAATPLARALRLSRPNPQGVLFIGAHAWAREMAHALHKENCPVLLVDTDWENISRARMMGLPCYYGSALSEQTRHEINFSDLGRMLAVTSNVELNSLACQLYVEWFGRHEVYQLPFDSTLRGRLQVLSPDQRGRLLFASDATFERLSELFGSRPAVNKTKFTKEFNFASFRAKNRLEILPLFLINPGGQVSVSIAHASVMPQSGDTLIYLRSSSDPVSHVE